MKKFDRPRYMVGVMRNASQAFEVFAASRKFSEGGSDYFFDFLRQRLATVSIRSYFVSALSSYLECSGACKTPTNDALFHAQLPLVADWIIAIQYLENQILDGKGGLCPNGNLDWPKTRQNLLASHLLKDLLYQYIDHIFENDPQGRNLTTQAVNKILRLTDMGQFYEIHYNTFEHYENPPATVPSLCEEADNFIAQHDIEGLWERIRDWGVPSSKETYVKAYLHRVTLTGTAMFVVLGELVGELHGCWNNQIKSNLRKYAWRYGIASLLVNDALDFVPSVVGHKTVEKTPEDAFNDLKRRSVTLPLMFYLSKNNNITPAMLLDILTISEQHLFDKISTSIYTDFKPFVSAFGYESLCYLDADNSVYHMLAKAMSITNTSRYNVFDPQTNAK